MQSIPRTVFHVFIFGLSSDIVVVINPSKLQANNSALRLRKRILSRFSMEYLFAFLPKNARELTQILDAQTLVVLGWWNLPYVVISDNR